MSNVCDFLNSFLKNTCFVLIEVIFLFNSFSVSSKSVFFTKLTISFLLAKFACANLAAKFSPVNLLNSGVVIWSGTLTTVRAVVVADLVILSILFLTTLILALRAAFEAKLITLGISLFTSFILALRVVLVAKLVILGILSSISMILALYTSFLITSFSLHHFVYLNQLEQILVY